MQIAVIVQGHQGCRHHSSFLLGIPIWVITLEMLLVFGHLSKQRSQWVASEWQAAFDLNIKPMSFLSLALNLRKKLTFGGTQAKSLAAKP